MLEKLAKEHPKLTDLAVKYVKYNFFGIFVFIVSSFVYWVFGSGGWIAFIMAGGIGGFVEFTLQLNFVYGSGKFFERLNPQWKRYDDILHGRPKDASG